jgi:hypothetical protein
MSFTQSLQNAARALAMAGAIVLAVGGAPASAADLAEPTGEVVLEVMGNIQTTNTAEGAMFDMDMLRALPRTQFTTSTIWTEGDITFEGVELSVILDLVGAQGAELSAVALNDYAVSIPSADAVPGGPIIAYSMNGEPMSRRDKGPLWIVYPYDVNPDYRTKVFYSRSIWQLLKLQVN